jgi:hypothetical protein
LEHKASGRGKQFCGAKCRVYYRRAMRRWSSRVVDAALRGEPEPERDFGHPIQLGRYRVLDDGSLSRVVTKRRGSGDDRLDA